MTRKHFKAIAEALASEKPLPHWDANKMTQWELDVRAMARALAQFNSAFDYERFYTACGFTTTAKAQPSTDNSQLQLFGE